MNDASVYLGRQRGEGSPFEGTIFVHVFFALNQEQYMFFFFSNVRDSSAGDRNYKKGLKLILSMGDPSPPPSVYQGGDTDIIDMIM